MQVMINLEKKKRHFEKFSKVKKEHRPYNDAQVKIKNCIFNGKNECTKCECDESSWKNKRHKMNEMMEQLHSKSR